MIPHLPLVSGICAGFLAQLLKFFTRLIRDRKVDFRTLVTTGGMPSSHTALVVGLTTSIGLSQGWSDPLFDVALVFSFIVMYDAAGVRRAAGRQAKILNDIVAELQHDFKFSFPRLQELLGHTPREVFGGAILGIVVALVAYRFLG
ncbi:MAG: divergent PAP2 family protein [Candidatus Sericytochromatia bacterium]|nr:divergent PAP2 family protein [Candidatus Tanganyikabacteria bacterium]